MKQSLTHALLSLLCALSLTAAGGCGNKGPLQQPPAEQSVSDS